MTREELIQKILEDRRAKETQKKSLEESAKKDKASDETLGHIADMLDGLADILTKNTQHVRIKNHPKEQKVKGVISLKEADDILDVLEQVADTIEDNIKGLEGSLIKAINQESTVTVKNFELPQIPAPLEHVSATITGLPPMVEERLTAIEKAVKGLTLSTTVTPTPVEIQAPDFTPLEDRLKALESSLTLLIDKEVVTVEKPDFSPVQDALKGLNATMEEVRDKPQAVPTFKSSWDKSFDMQSKDLPTSFGYTSNDPSNPDYIDVSAGDGAVYRKTFTYTTVAGVKVVSSLSAWTKI